MVGSESGVDVKLVEDKPVESGAGVKVVEVGRKPSESEGDEVKVVEDKPAEKAGGDDAQVLEDKPAGSGDEVKVEDNLTYANFEDEEDHEDYDFGEKFSFCPRCSNLLTLDVSDDLPSHRYICASCPFFLNVSGRVVIKKVLEKPIDDEDDIFDTAKADDHRQRTEVICPECSHTEAFFFQMQTRSADEPMTNFYQCCNKKCRHNWRD